MKRKPPPGTCVYCLQTHDSLTWDHVFPRSWYPNSTPADMKKWRVPCCCECNNAYSRIEQHLFVRLGICLDGGDEAAQGIPQKARRSLDSRIAKNEKDGEMRSAQLEKIKREIQFLDRIPSKGMLPGFENISDLQKGGVASIGIDPEKLKAFGEKLVRGFNWVLDERLIGTDCSISVEFSKPRDAGYINDLAERYGAKRFLGPGLELCYANAADNPRNVLYVIRIWDRLDIYAIVLQEPR